MSLPAQRLTFVYLEGADMDLIAEEVRCCSGDIAVTHLLALYTLIYTKAKEAEAWEGGECGPKTYKTLLHIADFLGYVHENPTHPPPVPSLLRQIARNRFLLTDICEYKENKDVSNQG